MIIITIAQHFLTLTNCVHLKPFEAPSPCLSHDSTVSILAVVITIITIIIIIITSSNIKNLDQLTGFQLKVGQKYIIGSKGSVSIVKVEIRVSMIFMNSL